MYKILTMNGFGARMFVDRVVSALNAPFTNENWTLSNVAGSIGLDIISQRLGMENLARGRATFSRKRSDKYEPEYGTPDTNRFCWVLNLALYTLGHNGWQTMCEHFGVVTMYFYFNDEDLDAQLQALVDNPPKPVSLILPTAGTGDDMFTKAEAVDHGLFFPTHPGDDELFRKVFGVDTETYIAAGGMQVVARESKSKYDADNGCLRPKVAFEVMAAIYEKIMDALDRELAEDEEVIEISQDRDSEDFIRACNMRMVMEPGVEFVIVTNDMTFVHPTIPVLILYSGNNQRLIQHHLVALDKGKIYEITYRCLRDMTTYEEPATDGELMICGSASFGLRFERFGRIIQKASQISDDV